MLDFSWTELLLIVILGVLVLGPKEVPQIMYGLGKFVRRLQYMKFALTNRFDEFMMQAELHEPTSSSSSSSSSSASQQQKTDIPPEEDGDLDEEEVIEKELSFLKDLREKEERRSYESDDEREKF